MYEAKGIRSIGRLLYTHNPLYLIRASGVVMLVLKNQETLK